MPSFAVQIRKEAFTFCAGHFITYAGDVCEPLHGHNYRVAVCCEGPLDANSYVIDFLALRDAVLAITRGLDHRMLLPTRHPMIRVEEGRGPLGGVEVVATFRDRRWVFPRQDCVLLPVANTTAELLAHWIGERLVESLGAERPPGPLVVEVDECEGQVGVCHLGGS